jgi:hypothetical protein
MRPLLPQSRFNFPVLLKLVGIYGVITLIVLLCVVAVGFAVSNLNSYRFAFENFGKRVLIEMLRYDFVGMDSDFIRIIKIG